MKILKIKNSWFKDSDLRLDAKCHLSEGRVAKVKVLKSPYKIEPLSNVTQSIYNGSRFKRYYVEDHEKGIPFMGSSDMLKSDQQDLKLISKKHSKNVDKLLLNKDWILVSCSGTIGNTVYTNKDFEGKTASQHIMRVIPNDSIKSGFLYAYLSSIYGYNLLTQGTYGAVIQHIEPHHIEKLPVPLFPEEKQQQIHQLIVDASDLRVEANRLLNEAVQIFEHELNYGRITNKAQYGKISSKDLLGFHKRLDGQYQLIWKKIKKEYSRKIQFEKIENFASSIFVGGRGKRNYVENGIPFLSSSDMMLYNPIRLSKKISSSTNGIEQMKVSKKDILISRSGTVGNTVIVGDELNNIVISEHALRLKIDSDKISPNYVFAFLKTNMGLKAMEASAFGSVIITLNEDLIGHIDLPILSNELQGVISEKIEEFISFSDKSTIKENQAITLIEKEIDLWQVS